MLTPELPEAPAPRQRGAGQMAGWTVDTLAAHFQQQLDDLRALLTERADTQQRAVDDAFKASEKAVDRQTARLDAEFHEHLVQYRHEVQLQLEAADKAINKSDAATEKRFESVNEFRGQLNDQVNTFVARTEYNQGVAALLGRLEADGRRFEQLITSTQQRSDDRVSDMQKRLDLAEGKSKGINSAWGLLVGVVGLFLAVLGVVTFFNGAS